MAERLFADRADRMGALCRGGGDRAHRVAILCRGRPCCVRGVLDCSSLRSVLLFCSTTANVFAVRQLQLSETATISFLTPIFVALLAGPVLGEKVSAERMIAIALGFLGVVIATRPGTAAFQPIVLLAVAGVVCNSGYVLATRKLAGADAPQTTLAWTQIAGLVFLTPILPWVWRQPGQWELGWSWR